MCIVDGKIYRGISVDILSESDHSLRSLFSPGNYTWKHQRPVNDGIVDIIKYLVESPHTAHLALMNLPVSIPTAYQSILK